MISQSPTDNGWQEVVVQLTETIRLMVIKCGSGEYIASISTLVGQKREFLCSNAFVTARVDGGDPEDADEPPSIWLGETNFQMPWHELNKVADFLKLPMPLPHPLGEQVPA